MGAVLRFRVSGRRAQTLLTETAKRFMYRQAGKDVVRISLAERETLTRNAMLLPYLFKSRFSILKITVFKIADATSNGGDGFGTLQAR